MQERKRIFKEIHDILGGRVRLFINGAAALDREVERGYNELGFRIAQGYGLTETSPVIAAATDDHYREGSVGQIFPSLEVRIANPNEEGIGEIQVKGPSVMLGYCDNEEANKKALKVIKEIAHLYNISYFMYYDEQERVHYEKKTSFKK